MARGSPLGRAPGRRRFICVRWHIDADGMRVSASVSWWYEFEEGAATAINSILFCDASRIGTRVRVEGRGLDGSCGAGPRDREQITQRRLQAIERA
jgi:hypothetical protein